MVSLIIPYRDFAPQEDASFASFLLRHVRYKVANRISSEINVMAAKAVIVAINVVREIMIWLSVSCTQLAVLFVALEASSRSLDRGEMMDSNGVVVDIIGTASDAD